MKKFMVLFTSTIPAEQQMNVSPEEMKKGMEPWFAWFEKVGDAVVDRGMPLGKGISITKEGSSQTSLHVAGYSILQAEDMDKVKEILTDHPHLTFIPGAGIEVLEFLPIPGM